MQLTVLLISLAGMLMVSSAFVHVIRNTSVREDDYSLVTHPAYRIRRWWMIALCAVGFIVTLATLMPYPLTSASGGNSTIIKATGGQWYWNLDQTSAVAGEPVQFHVSSADVNHGFAIYNPDNRIVAQTQAMPGYVNKLNVIFNDVGTHRIMCLEYCGLAHHAMIVDFEVTKGQ